MNKVVTLLIGAALGATAAVAVQPLVRPAHAHMRTWVRDGCNKVKRAAECFKEEV
ncbi:MAG: hypothetical protein FWD16_07880 [Clostridia bacterium]|nr:hypothetical protein [Clostridia bacterium]